MIEVQEVPAEDVTENTDTAVVKEQKMNFSKVRETAWQESQETLTQRTYQFCTENQPQKKSL